MALNSVDTLMIEWLIDVNHVGYYHSGLKLIDTILIIPALFGASIFPFVSKFHHSSDRLKKMAEESLGIMGLIGIPITCCGILLAPNILTFVYSTAYAPGSLAFTILLGSVFPTFIIYILNNFLLATNHEKICVKNTGVGFSINILINTALIPILGINGAAIGTLLSRLTLLGLAIYHAKKQLSFHGIDLKKIGVYLFFSGILFGSLVALQYVINHVLLLILIGTALYGLMLIASNDPYAKKIVTLFKKNAPHNQ
jgi:O-antigen/teichoic acid export membrane protein